VKGTFHGNVRASPCLEVLGVLNDGLHASSLTDRSLDQRQQLNAHLFQLVRRPSFVEGVSLPALLRASL
jgi:hypothetical protein